MENLQAMSSTLDQQLVAVSDRKRRRLLSALVEAEPQSTELFGASESISNEERRRHLVEMHHRHLPKLEARGFVEWDREDRLVTRGPRFEEIRPLIELLDEHGDRLPGTEV